MSILGRRIIDTVKKRLPSLGLPVPPYDSTQYWERVYSGLNDFDCHEWANVALVDLLEPGHIVYSSGPRSEPTSDLLNLRSIESRVRDERCYTILNLGCGNSNFGLDLHQYLDHSLGIKNKMIQVDVSASVISSMQSRYGERYPGMAFEHADAFHLAYHNLDAVIDKGLVDAIFCSNPEKILPIFESVNGCLRKDGVFMFLSLSHPDHVIGSIETSILKKDTRKGIEFINKSEHNWKSKWHIEVRELSKIYSYKLLKVAEMDTKNKLLPKMQVKVRRQ
jgi:hypothetical protein